MNRDNHRRNPRPGDVIRWPGTGRNGSSKPWIVTEVRPDGVIVGRRWIATRQAFSGTELIYGGMSGPAEWEYAPDPRMTNTPAKKPARPVVRCDRCGKKLDANTGFVAIAGIGIFHPACEPRS
jgi:hypothetical protein